MEKKKECNYEDIKSIFNENDMIKSLNDGVIKKYSGFLSLSNNTLGYDSFNKDLVLFKNGEFAEIVEKGIDNDIGHYKNIRDRCKKYGISPFELLEKDYLESK